MSPPQPEAPAFDRVDPPGGLLLPLGFELGGQPALRVPRLDLADLADLAVADHLAREHDHREAGVGVGDDERHVLRGDGRVQATGLVEGGRQRLLAQDADPRVGGGLGRAEVRVVGRDDRQVVDPFGLAELRFGLDQGAPVGVSAREEQLAGRLERLVGLAPQGAGGQLGRVVEQDRAAVRTPEEIGGPAAADHPHPHLPLAHRDVPRAARPPGSIRIAGRAFETRHYSPVRGGRKGPPGPITADGDTPEADRRPPLARGAPASYHDRRRGPVAERQTRRP